MEDNVTYATVVIKDGKQLPKGKKVWALPAHLLTLVFNSVTFMENQTIELVREAHCGVTVSSWSGIQACLHEMQNEKSYQTR